ncbi:ROK family transcriptional regulator [Variovorax dokdonensis]|uniref:ROK family transcriptional regulator n=1 Tax=Variovorax dokdonensis TaxID=344883 RepID=A0ABT7NGJ2_9BURK|nr:ROK family transcriptional regulator [Variovorax dokdonensis]MDM0047033.1 ROK family transcriptional regulator [Variovorax dokdonensis]
MRTTGDQQLVKRINRSVLLRLSRAQPGLSRARLAQESGLTKSTVTLLVRELLQEGWLHESGAPVADGAGRPSTPLAIDVGVRALAGIEVGVERMRLACVSLQGALLHSDEEALEDPSPECVSRQSAALAAQAQRALAARGLRLAGIGVGVPGAVDQDSGRVRFAPNLGWRDVDLLSPLSAALQAARVGDVPVQLQNEADAAALGEYEFDVGEGGAHPGSDTDPLIFVNCDVGVGAGIVLNDRLFVGAQGMAGEIGHTILEVDGPACSCGRRGCAEAFFGSRALSRSGSDPERAARFLGVLLQNLWVTFNPRVIVVGGASCANDPQLLARACDAVAQYASDAGLPMPQVRAARYGALAPAVGASAFVLHEYLRPLHPAAHERQARQTKKNRRASSAPAA